MSYLSITMAETIEHIAAVAAGGDREEAAKILIDHAAEDAIRADISRGRVPRWAWQCLRRGDGRIRVAQNVIHAPLFGETINYADIRFRRAGVERLWPARVTSRTSMPLPVFIESRNAVQEVCDTFGCSEADAVRFLGDQRLAGNLDLRFVAVQPPAGFTPAQINWLRTPNRTAGRSASR